MPKPYTPYALALLTALLVLGACDQQKIAELSPSYSTQAEVEAQWGQPEAIWDGPNGERIFEYNRQPNGRRNYHISIAPDGRMLRIEQVLNAANFARVQPGMRMEEVRPLLGRPAKERRFQLQNEVHWEWRYLAPDNTTEMLFSVVFDAPTMRVKSSGGAPDPAGRQLQHPSLAN